MAQYTTEQGDTWDGIAYKIYGSEGRMHELLTANWPLLDIMIFANGVVLDVPDISETVSDSLPFWRR